MKQSLKIIAASIALGAASSALAASSVDLSVKGVITPSACTPSLAGGGVVDYGKISIKDLELSGGTQLPTLSVQLGVTCEAATLFALKSRDNRPGTVNDPSSEVSFFGLGLMENGKKMGRYYMQMNNTLADNAPVAVIESVTGDTWLATVEGSQVWQPQWMRAFDTTPGGELMPSAIRSLRTDILVTANVTTAYNMPAGQEVPMDGSATFDIVYL